MVLNAIAYADLTTDEITLRNTQVFADFKQMILLTRELIEQIA